MPQKTRKVLLRLLTAIAFIVLCSSGSFAKTIEGKVIGVADGDTLTILSPEKEQIKVRLVEIDAPEKGQPYGNASKKTLSSEVFGEIVSIETTSTDKYGRTLGRVYVDGKDINLHQVQIGSAWAYTRYLTDENIKEAEEKARNDRLGLWGLDSAQTVAPWDWRRGVRTSISVIPSSSTQAQSQSLSFLYMLLALGLFLMAYGFFKLCRQTAQDAQRIKEVPRRPISASKGKIGLQYWLVQRLRVLRRNLALLILPILIGILGIWGAYDDVIPSLSLDSSRNTKCGTKYYCRHMDSCAEAKFYMDKCGLTRLDGDGDGVPCESICR